MSTAICLIVYSLAVLLAGPPLMFALTREGHAPRLGVAAWLVAIGTVLLTWLAAAGIVTVELAGHWEYPGIVVASCLAALRGVVADSAGSALHIASAVVIAATALLAMLASGRLARTVSRMRARAHQHAEAVRLVGHPTVDPQVVVLEAAEPAAYCVSGRPPAIVVTSAALAALDTRELAAVLAHERAHLTGRHSLLVTTLHSLAAALPKLGLIRQGATQVSRLLEMCADDAAIRQHGSGALLSGLITLCRAAPAEALGAADVAVLARAERLAVSPADSQIACIRAALISAVAAMVAGPFVIAALANSGALMCGMYR
ncbi:M56 family metallopeptidase [Mycobacterium kubicae]|uniref:M56 family metallopeptidase n=1 Tax=Mycobacterium kubicae TaxID=120959 RepID=UPI001640F9C6|nr:M56 family metallopeptidase [Mycobacterium kubicae]QNI07748.1 M56 family metallopeptidase [Mycobacterium kubicae]